jgi:hypothetical protein
MGPFEGNVVTWSPDEQCEPGKRTATLGRRRRWPRGIGAGAANQERLGQGNERGRTCLQLASLPDMTARGVARRILRSVQTEEIRA